QLRLLAVVRAGGIAERGPDAAEALGDQLVVRDPRACLVPGAARELVHVLREGFGEAVGESLDHDRLVVVVLCCERGGELVRAETRGDRERAQVVSLRGDVVRQAAIRARVAVIRLLAQEAEARSLV